ncbi:hypothetical protein AB1Y20_011295 [Prymnesium parvum]|uniref:HMA domain-containing protein n=1 Tax=Prymnesium parvum TaxID=97485 RepID=A0AB34INF9_PRYPA
MFLARPVALQALSQLRPMAMALAAPNTSAMPSQKAEYLIWDRGFVDKLCLSLAACGVVGWFAATHASSLSMQLQGAVSSRLVAPSPSFKWWSLLGMLSSSCCALQLALNTLSIGCAGFNTLLGPIRPMMMALTLSLQSAMWTMIISRRGSSHLRSSIAVSLSTTALMFLPEILHAWLHRSRVAEDAADLLTIHVSGMGCTACTAKVQQMVEAVEGVAKCDVHLETGVAQIYLARSSASSADGIEAIGRACEEAIVSAGFGTQP